MLLRFIIAFLENENQYRTTVTLNRMVNRQEGVKKIHPSFRLTPTVLLYPFNLFTMQNLAVSDIIYTQFVRLNEMFFDFIL